MARRRATTRGGSGARGSASRGGSGARDSRGSSGGSGGAIGDGHVWIGCWISMVVGRNVWVV
jgi:hypothetical protein